MPDVYTSLQKVACACKLLSEGGLHEISLLAFATILC